MKSRSRSVDCLGKKEVCLFLKRSHVVSVISKSKSGLLKVSGRGWSQ